MDYSKWSENFRKFLNEGFEREIKKGYEYEKDKDLGDIAFAQCMFHIKEVVQEYLFKDEIKFEIEEAAREAIKEFLEDNFKELTQCIAKEIGRNISFDLDVTFNNCKESQRKDQ